MITARTYKLRGLYLEIDEDTLFEFPDDADMLSVTGTFNVLRKVGSGKYVSCSNFQKKKMAIAVIVRATNFARKLLKEKQNASD